ncbi:MULTISPECIES: hypothetical protein [unclassified Oceanispirochaeta]|uniref:hypothetical protein n=1 Tax=unclassified Oceanispirochaeta TaxID=2635722 RepID=UPI000E09258F|nr:MULTISPECIES: hypothetical protein [unclassified Oceanispirochaeta]MBF9018479.1 hypothetical protein [Oceanispirochaeta sp. M2]NPD74885.1 hypothetical protein [Oceanispirochaeta sp. M1]RDG29272.1 hypothetical protein DV872_22570 [Oceanispirochaeta sp. M1]
MSTWTGNKANSDSEALARYTPKDITNSKDLGKELSQIERDQSLNFVDKYKQKKQLVRTALIAKQQEISHHLDSYENYLMARKDVESKAIALEAQKAIMVLEGQQLDLMKSLGLSHSDEIAATLIRSGEMLTSKIREVNASDMEDDIKKTIYSNIRQVWEKTNNRILESVDSYMEELYAREKARI